jgi:hypothetical protein
LSIADFRLALAIKPIHNRKSKIKNPDTHALPRDGTDLIGVRPVTASAAEDQKIKNEK